MINPELDGGWLTECLCGCLYVPVWLFGCLSMPVWPHDCAHTAIVAVSYTPTMADNIVVDWEVDGTQFEVEICNTSGHNFKNQYTCRML